MARPDNAAQIFAAIGANLPPRKDRNITSPDKMLERGNYVNNSEELAKTEDTYITYGTLGKDVKPLIELNISPR